MLNTYYAPSIICGPYLGKLVLEPISSIKNASFKFIMAETMLTKFQLLDRSSTEKIINKLSFPPF